MVDNKGYKARQQARSEIIEIPREYLVPTAADYNYKFTGKKLLKKINLNFFKCRAGKVDAFKKNSRVFRSLATHDTPFLN